MGGLEMGVKISVPIREYWVHHTKESEIILLEHLHSRSYEVVHNTKARHIRNVRNDKLFSYWKAYRLYSSKDPRKKKPSLENHQSKYS